MNGNITGVPGQTNIVNYSNNNATGNETEVSADVIEETNGIY